MYLHWLVLLPRVFISMSATMRTVFLALLLVSLTLASGCGTAAEMDATEIEEEAAAANEAREQYSTPGQHGAGQHGGSPPSSGN
jgi:hypothetical protein